MARDHTRINLDIWGDDEFRDLPVDAQALYWTLWTSPGRTYCGSHEWRPGKLSQCAGDWTVDRILSAAKTLSENLFLIVDDVTEECLLRSWIKHDGLWKVPNMAVTVALARAALGSKTLRGVIVHEVLKLREARPELSSWQRSEVQKMLGQNAINPTDIPTFNPPLNPCANPPVKGYGQLGVNPPPNPPSTTATSTSYLATATSTSTALALGDDSEAVSHAGSDGRGKALARIGKLNECATSPASWEITRAFTGEGKAPLEEQAKVAASVEKCLRAGVGPEQIAAGLQLWAESDSWAASQIGTFVAKAGRKAKARPNGADAKGSDWIAFAAQLDETQNQQPAALEALQ